MLHKINLIKFRQLPVEAQLILFILYSMYLIKRVRLITPTIKDIHTFVQGLSVLSFLDLTEEDIVDGLTFLVQAQQLANVTTNNTFISWNLIEITYYKSLGKITAYFPIDYDFLEIGKDKEMEFLIGYLKELNK